MTVLEPSFAVMNRFEDADKLELYSGGAIALVSWDCNDSSRTYVGYYFSDDEGYVYDNFYF